MDLTFQNLTAYKRYKLGFFEKIFIEAIREKIKNKKIEASVNLVGESRIRELNKKYRGKDKVTDVLSFPMLENFETLNSKLEIHDLGDIFICLSFAKKQAKSENVSIGYKLAQLTVHGFLHLLGYDHEKSEKDEIEMFNLENKILKKCQDKGQFAGSI